MKLVTIVAILCLTALEIIAIVKGIDGNLFAITVAAIALLAPSPVFQVRWRDWIITKGSVKGDDGNGQG